jgi:hypothetical protein
VDAVRAIDVRVASRQEHRGVALRAPVAEAVGGGILVVVRLDLDDRPADTVDEELRADQLRRDLVDVPLQVQERALRSASTTRS